VYRLWIQILRALETDVTVLYLATVTACLYNLNISEILVGHLHRSNDERIDPTTTDAAIQHLSFSCVLPHAKVTDLRYNTSSYYRGSRCL